jgi:signal transduction histidine kinase
MSSSVGDTSYNKAEEEFLSVVAHEVRTPLSITKWYTEMLLDGDAGELNPEQKKYLLTIEASNSRAIGLLRSILNVSRLTLGTFSISPTEINLRDVVKQVLQDLTKESARKGIVIKEIYEGAVPGMLASMQADKQICTVLVRTLIANAIAYSHEGKEVIVSVVETSENTTIAGYTLPEDSFVVSVQDFGIGIEENDKQNIFTKFFKGSNAGDSSGSGLGLYLNHLIIEKVGGHIWYESVRDSGSTFYIAFPKHGMQRKEGRVTLD